MAGINHIRRWVMSQMTKKADDGIMITLPDSKKVDLNVSITMDRLMRNGIDPNQITNPQQVNNAINMINTRMVNRAIAADSPEGREITEKLFGKQKAPVFDMEGNKIPEGSGIMGGKSVKDLMKSGQVTKGTRGMKKSKKVTDREMFKSANERLKTEAQLKKEIESNNKKGVAGIKKRQLTEDEYQDFLDEIGGADQLEAYNFDGTVGDAKRIIKEQKDYMSQMKMEFKKGRLDPKPGSRTPARKRFLQKKLEEAESSGDARLLSREEREELFDLDDIPEYSTGGRAGFFKGAIAGGGNISPGTDTGGNVRDDNPFTGGGGGPEGPPKQEKEPILKTRNILKGYNQHNINNQKLKNAVSLGLISNDEYNVLGGFDVNQTMGLNPFLTGVGSGLYNVAQSLTGDQKFSEILGDVKRNVEGSFGLPEELQKKYDDIMSMDSDEMTGQLADLRLEGKNMLADGGITRAKFAGGGMGRRGFLKLLASAGAGIGALKSGLLKFAGKEPAKQVLKSAGSGTPPPYFFKLAEKIKMLGDDVTPRYATQERQIVKQYKDYELTEDLGTGKIEISKKNIPEGDEAVDYFGEPLMEDVYMSYKPGEMVEGAGGKVLKSADEYIEDTAYVRTSGRQTGDISSEIDGITEGTLKKILKEVGEQAPSIKKASGGIARMLGE